MKIEGKVKKSGKYWAVEVPLLLIFTQGKSKKDALLMAKDAVDELIGNEIFSSSVSELANGIFSVSSNNDSLLISVALKQQRLHRGLSIRDVSLRMGSNSPTAYSRYEKGTVKPSLDKFSELLKAIDADLEPILKIG